MNEWQLEKDSLAKRMAGEIVLSDDGGKTIQKWRNIFKISQRALAECVGVTPSVISDYESGRRKSPGIKVIKKIVGALINIDDVDGGKTIREFSYEKGTEPVTKSIIDVRDFGRGIPVLDFCRAMGAVLLTKNEPGEVHGYTIIDSLRAIVEFSYADLVKLASVTSGRALIFTNVSRGRSPMVAIKVTNLRPGLVVMHGIKEVDEVAKRIAEVESIPLAVMRTGSAEELVKRLAGRFG